jgi:hypothetical protein
MSKSSDVLSVTRREFLAGAGTIATTGYLVIQGSSSAIVAGALPAGKPDRVITFDATQTPIGCSISPKPTGAVVDPCGFTVNTKEVVSFKAITSKTKHHLAVMFVGDTPFVDNKDQQHKVWAFHGSDMDEANDGIGKDASISSKLKEGDSFEFLIGIWDEDDTSKIKSFTVDPTIIIGKGGSGIASAIAKLSAADGLLMKAAEAYPPKSDEIKSIEDRVTTLIAQLKELLYNPPGQTK